jgi:hypothetical protein
MKRAVYENITKNFDVFEFLDKDPETNTLPNEKTAKPSRSGVEADDHLSDELEFEIDDNDVILNSDSLFRDQ